MCDSRFRSWERSWGDPATGLGSRGFFEAVLPDRFHAARAAGKAVTLLLAGIDEDEGWLAGLGRGEDVPRNVAAVLWRSVRASDIVCRFGSDEFALLLPAVESRDAVRLAERVRTAVKGCCGVTISVGAASSPEDAGSPERLLAIAERRLEAAKGEGRDRMRFSDARAA